MKTVEGVELKLGKCKLMPVKKINGDKLNDRIYNYAIVGKYEQERISKITPLKDESIQIIKEAKMVKNPYLVRMEEKYYQYHQKVISKMKPANYKD